MTPSSGQDVEVPISLEDTASAIQVGQTDAPVTIDYWFDFSCPHCIEYHQSTSQTIHDLVASGQAKINFRPINIVAPYGQHAAAALMSVLVHDPSKFFTVYDGLYLIPADQQKNWGDSDYADIMGQFGITDEAILDDIRNGTYLGVVTTNTDKALKSDGVHGTPTLAVNHQIQETLPDGPGLIALVAQNGGDPAAIPTASTGPNMVG